MSVQLGFNGVSSAGYGGYHLYDHILYNLRFWLDWGFVNIGAFETFQLDNESFYDDDESNLLLARDERYVEGTVWEGFGPSWVWESGIIVPSGEVEPFRVSGIYIDGTFYDQVVSSGTFEGHHVDYLHGRVIFDHPQNPDSTIRTEYVARKVKVDFADSLDHRLLMNNAVEEFAQDAMPSGTNVREHQAWLPAVFVEVNKGAGRGLQLGGGQIKTITITFHIFADNPWDRDKISNILDFQSRKAFFMADLNSIVWPFDQYGDIVAGTTNWIDLMSDYPGYKIRGMETKPENINSLNTRLFRAKVMWKVEIDIGGI